MKSLRIYPTSINEKYIDETAELLRNGGLIIYPTDSLYAIGCNALNNNAIEKICRIKGIDPRRETLSIVCCDISQASEYARIDNRSFRILRDNCPGAFTFILPAAVTLPKIFKGRHTVGIRIPDNPIARALAINLGNPLLSASLPIPDDREGMPLDNPDEIDLLYGDSSDIDMLIDGGYGDSQPSTIIDLTDSAMPEIIRQGKSNPII